MALVQELVRLHGGTVTASSVFGKGTTFTVTIPDAEPPLSGRRIASGTALVSTALGASPFVEEALRWFPAAEGNQVTGEGVAARGAGNVPARDAEGGRKSPRILLADDNADVRARQELGELSLVAVSGYGQDADRDKSRKAGFAAHLVKPVDPDRLNSVIEDLTVPVGQDVESS